MAVLGGHPPDLLASALEPGGPAHRGDRASDPAVTHPVPRDTLQGLLYPPIGLFHRFVRRDEARFCAALMLALSLHKAYPAHDGKLPIGVDPNFVSKQRPQTCET
ncbi:Imm49 family immunity protein [Streptomyces goshikiensis]|uniref:Imm49 family immunity protein n=1 Tax=Streptomyces goshikiensis TaxID=1942 RepID=UPI0036DC080C